MINKLFISNYAIIDTLEINFFEDLNIITGETGAGKSIILGALNLLLGNRFTSINFKDKSKKSIVEGEFSVSHLSVKDFLINHNLDYQDNLIIRREFLFEGKSRSFVNDTPVNLDVLKKIAVFLVDIHSQHQNLLINYEDFQINLLDKFSHTRFSEFSQFISDYNIFFKELQGLKIEIEEKKRTLHHQNYDLNDYRKTINHVESLNLIPNEKENLELEYRKLNNIHEIKNILNQVIFLFEDSESSIVNGLNVVNSKLSEIDSYDSKINKLLIRLKGNTIDINDILMDLHSINHDLNIDSNRLEILEHRINSINSLEKKFRTSNIQGVIDTVDSMKLKLASLENISNDLEKLELNIEQLSQKLFSIADNLTFFRKKSAVELIDHIKSDLISLGISTPNIDFDFQKSSELLVNGLDKVTLLFSSNKGYELKPVINIASGGEVARLMLCLKKYLFKIDNFSTIIFDEIDSGVSGDIGRKMGRILQKMSKQGQVICITHSAQIASLGKVHHKVLKNETSGITTTKIVELSIKNRVDEIARMLSGDEVNKESIANAKKMLDI